MALTGWTTQRMDSDAGRPTKRQLCNFRQLLQNLVPEEVHNFGLAKPWGPPEVRRQHNQLLTPDATCPRCLAVPELRRIMHSERGRTCVCLCGVAVWCARMGS